jgi:cytochrome P450
VLGNIFIFMFAGHEANANTLTFIFLLLACHPRIQRLVQSDIDRILGSSKTSTATSPSPAIPHSIPADLALDYDSHFGPLMASHLGATINEAGRLFTVLPYIPKTVPRASGPQTVTVEGKPHLIPVDTLVLINTSATHRNPKYWPRSAQVERAGKSQGGMPHAVAAFDPGFWRGGREDQEEEKKKKEKRKVAEATEDAFLKPEPGSYVPFSDGSRGCLGKRFALVELCAVLARILSEWSVELVADTGMQVCESEKEKRSHGREDRETAWRAARRKAEVQLSDGVKFDMSLRIMGSVPVRFVKRGEEAFGDIEA